MIPKFIKPFLWSYDTSAIDLNKHKNRIIINVLNLGTKKATDWLFTQYSKKEIINVLKSQYNRELSKKSRNFWSIILK